MTNNNKINEGHNIGNITFEKQNSIETCIKGETDHQPRLVAGDKCSRLVHWDDPEGSGGEGGGRGDRDGEYM